MKTKFFYLFDQLLFSLFNFFLFLVLDKRFPAVDVAEYSAMISGSALLLNFGFAIMIERLLGLDEKRISFYEFLVLVLLTIIASISIYFLLWNHYVHGLFLAAAMFSSALVWIVRRICVLDNLYVGHCIVATVISGVSMLLLAWRLNQFNFFLISYCVVYTCVTFYLSRLMIREVGQGLLSSLHSLVEMPGSLVKSLLIVPLLWFPSNGIYLALSFVGSASVMIETRKLLMLLSPIQQFSAAMINYIFSKGKGYASSYIELYVLPVILALAVTPLCAVVYNVLLRGANVEFLLWFSFALIIVCMLINSLIQSTLRVQGDQAAVILALTLVAVVKAACLTLIYSLAGEIDLTGGFVSMAVAYSVGALAFGITYASKHRRVC